MLKNTPVIKNMRITCPTDKTIKSTASSVGISLPKQDFQMKKFLLFCYDSYFSTNYQARL